MNRDKGNDKAALCGLNSAVATGEQQSQRRQRQQIFDVEDKIESRRDQLIAALEQRLHQKSSSHLLRIRWQLN